MSHIITEYEKNLGVKRKKPVVNKHFIPTGKDPYVLIFNEHLTPSKSYSHYSIVVDLLRKILEPKGIKIYQIGPSESTIGGIDKIFNNTSFRQSAYLISKAKALISTDNVYTQYASAVNIPVVNIYGNTYPSISEGAWDNKKVNIEPDWEVKPSFQSLDSSKNIDRILPETIINGVLNLLGFNEKINFATIHIGSRFYEECIDVVPTKYENLSIFSGKVLNLRLDYGGKEEAFFEYCLNHKCNLVMKDKLIQPHFLKTISKNVEKIYLFISEIKDLINIKYFELLKSYNIDLEILVTNEQILKGARLEYFDQKVELYKPHITKPENVRSNNFFFSLKTLVEGDCIYPSKAHWKNRHLPLDLPFKIVENQDFWEDLDYYYIYEQQ
jgi:hypothetical protein